MNKKILILFAIVFMLIPYHKVEAKTLGDLKKELANLEEKYKEAQNKKNLNEAEIKKVSSEITSITSSIEKTKQDIKKAEADIIASEEEISAKKEETNELLKFLQISSGENVYLEYIFEADSYTDFIYRYAVVTQLTEYNNNLMEELEELVDTLEKKKVEFQNKKVELEKKSDELTAKMAVLYTNSKTFDEEGATIEEDIRDMKKEIEGYEEIGCKDNENITSCGNKLVNATGWSYPMAKGCVTSEYVGFAHRPDWSGPAKGHHGIDLSCMPEGTTIYPAAAGKVARIVHESSCGGNMVWIYHKINGREYTTVYMHLLYISVSVGQTVTKDTKVGGMGGQSTKTYDRCTGGKHLHFGIAYGHNAYNFNNYSFNPRNVYNFPAIWYSSYKYFSR